MKMIFSSGDYFPGFYRFTLGTQVIGDESLSLNTLIWVYFDQKFNKKTHHKEDWIELQHEIYEREVASDQARNAGNYPRARELFSKKMLNWYENAQGFDIIYLDTETLVQEFSENQSYYFMGSIVHYKNDQLHISYNSLTDKSAFSIDISFPSVVEYLNSTYSAQDFNTLFLYSDTVATLDFTNEESGELVMKEDLLDSYLLLNSETKVFAAPFKSRSLPMRYAKPIRLTNFSRGTDGHFHVWRTDQNW